MGQTLLEQAIAVLDGTFPPPATKLPSGDLVGWQYSDPESPFGDGLTLVYRTRKAVAAVSLTEVFIRNTDGVSVDHAVRTLRRRCEAIEWADR